MGKVEGDAVSATVITVVTYFLLIRQTKLKSWPLCEDIFPLLVPSTYHHPKNSNSVRTGTMHQGFIHTHLLRHTEVLGAKQEHPIFQIKKLRLILPKFPQRRQSQNPTQVLINQVCPPIQSLCWSVLGPRTRQPPASGVALPAARPALFRVALEKPFASHRPRLAAWDASGFHKLAQLPAHTVTI